MSRPLLPVAAVCAITVIACSDQRPTDLIPVGPPAQMIVQAGDSQIAAVGTELAEALVVKALDAKGKPVRDQIVNFRIVAGGGEVFGGAALTNNDGEARERWTLGTAPGWHRLEARAVDATTGSPVVFAAFSARAVPGPVANVAVVAQPANARAGTVIAPAISIALSDSYGNTATNATAPVTVSIKAGTGASGAMLLGTTSRLPVNGTATFNDLAIDLAGSGYVLTVATGLVTAETNAFTITPAPVVARVQVRPLSFGIMVGDTVTMTATAFDASNAVIPGLTPTWLATSPQASIGSNNVLTGLAPGYAPLRATMGGVDSPEEGGVSVFATLDSLRWVFYSNGSYHGWTQATLSLGSSSCFRPYVWGPYSMTNPLRWNAQTSDASVVQVVVGTDLPQTRCFKAVGTGTATITATFNGQIATKFLTVP